MEHAESEFSAASVVDSDRSSCNNRQVRLRIHYSFQKTYVTPAGKLTYLMPSPFIRAKPLQTLKLTAVVSALTFAFASIVGILPAQDLGSLLYLAFFPMILAVVVGAEALLAGYRLAQADDPAARLTARRGYTVVRAIELVVTVAAPGIFYVLIVQIGGEVAGPGAIGLLFIGIALGLVAYAAVLLRTLTEYYSHRKRSSLSRTTKRGENVTE